MNIQDGKVTFAVRDKRLQALFDMIHPVGSVYTTIKDGKPFELGTWQEVGQGRVLQGVGNGQTAGTTVEAGVPNITGKMDAQGSVSFTATSSNNGAFRSADSLHFRSQSTTTQSTGGRTMTFDASRSSAVYGKSNTVQPPAYLVHFWVRTA